MRALILTLPLAFTSCSFTKFAFTRCDMNQECRDAFGWGYVCAEELCQEVDPIPRCGRTYPEDLFDDVEGYRDRVVYGVQFDQSQFATESRAAEFAIEEVMKASGLGGKGFAAVVCTNEESSLLDGLAQDQANVMVSEYLANQVGVSAIIGPATSDRVEDAFQAVKRFGTLVMSPTATSPSLTPLDGSVSTTAEPGLLWRTSPPDDLQGAELAALMEADGMDTVAFIVEEGNYGTALGAIGQSAFEDGGGEATLVPYESGSAASLQEKIGIVEDMDVDGVAFISSDREDTQEFLQFVSTSAADASYTCSSADRCPFSDDGATIYLADGGKDLGIFESVSGIERVLDRIHGTAPAHELGSVYNVFADSFDAKWGAGTADSTPFTSYAYDAAWLVIYGSAWAHYNEAAIDGLGIARGLRRISEKRDGTTQVDVGRSSWNSVRAEFEAAQPIDVQGASGALDYDPNTGETSAPIEYWCVTSLAGEDLTFAVVNHPSEGVSRCEI